MARSPPCKGDIFLLSRRWPLAMTPKSPRELSVPLLTFVGDTVHRPLICGVKGGEGATG